MFVQPLQLIDETIERLEILAEFFAEEVDERTTDPIVLTPEARTCKEAMLTISVLVPKLQRARAMQELHGESLRPPESQL